MLSSSSLSQRLCRSLALLANKRPLHSDNRRVVVTGLGLVSPLGVGTPIAWKNLLDGASGVRAATFEGCNRLPSQVAAYVPSGTSDGEFNSEEFKGRGIGRFSEFALCAAKEAIDDAGWRAVSEEDERRAGVAIASGIGDIEGIVDATKTLSDERRGLRRLSPFFIPQILINLASGHVSIEHRLKGPNHAAVTACASSAHSIGDAAKLIRDGDADVMIAGGAEACIGYVTFAGFSRMKCQALCTTFNDTPEEASRPFDIDRSGFVMGEGAGVIVLEERERAIQRGARIYAELVGVGLSGDAYHMTAPSEDGDGAKRAMAAALRSAQIEPRQVGYLNAHSTSTPMGDTVELNAVRSLFKEAAASLPISSTKGATGHLLGAAGAVEAVFTILSLYHQILPGTRNLKAVEQEYVDMNILSTATKVENMDYALSNSFGFGGTNAALCFGRHRDGEK